jgi:hypothetical protein
LPTPYAHPAHGAGGSIPPRSNFPENREINREFAKILVDFGIPWLILGLIIKQIQQLEVNSLFHQKTGNYVYRNREFLLETQHCFTMKQTQL